MFIPCLLASALTFTLAAQPAPGPRGAAGPMGPRGPMAMAGEGRAFLAHHLKLSEAQKNQIKEVHQKHREGIQTRQKAVAEAREAFRKASQDPAANTEQLRRLHQTVADRQFEVMLEHRAVRAETRALLTPEQRAEADRLQSLGEERRQFRQGWMRKYREGRPMPGRPGMGPGGPGGPGGAFEE